MSLRRLFSSSQEAQFLHRIEIPISYSALFFRVTGTNGATPATARQVGRIRFTIRQQPVVDCDFDALQALANHWYGSQEFNSAGSGAFNASVLIPRSYLGDGNVERVTKADAAIFETGFSTDLFTNIASGFLAELYAVTAEAAQSYNLLLFQQTIPTVAASSIFKDDISTTENLLVAYLSDIVGGIFQLIGSNIESFRARKGDVTVDVFRTAAMAYTASKYRIEGALTPTTSQIMAEIFGLDSSDFSARLEDMFELTVQNGSGGTSLPQVLTVGFKPNPDRLGESALEIKNRLARARQEKAAAGKTRALQIIDSVTG